MGEEKEEETNGFINENNHTNPSVKYAERKKCSSCCTRKCGLISCGVSVVVLLVIFGGGLISYYIRINASGLTSENSQEWENKILNNGLNGGSQSSINGSYKLVSYDENYNKYLAATGIPSLVIMLITGTPSTVSFQTPDDLEFGVWKQVTEGIRKVTKEFSLHEEFEVDMGRNRLTFQTASMPNNHTLVFDIKDREKGFEFTSTFLFTNAGAVNERHFITKNITTKKYYERIIPGVNDGSNESTSPSPFSEDSNDDDEFWDDDEW